MFTPSLLSRALVCAVLCVSSFGGLSACVLSATPESGSTSGTPDMASDQGVGDLGADQGVGDMGAGDMSADMTPDMTGCVDVCEEGREVCEEGGVGAYRVCERLPGGCTVWTGASCPASQTCKPADQDRIKCEAVSQCEPDNTCDLATPPRCDTDSILSCVEDPNTNCPMPAREDCGEGGTCKDEGGKPTCVCAQPVCEVGALRCANSNNRPQRCTREPGALCPRWTAQPLCGNDEQCEAGVCVPKVETCPARCMASEQGHGRCSASEPDEYEICERDANDASCLRWVARQCGNAGTVGSDATDIRACQNYNTAVTCERDAAGGGLACHARMCVGACADASSGQITCVLVP